MIEATRRGTILAVIRLGNIDLENPFSPAMDAPPGGDDGTVGRPPVIRMPGPGGPPVAFAAETTPAPGQAAEDDASGYVRRPTRHRRRRPPGLITQSDGDFLEVSTATDDPGRRSGDERPNLSDLPRRRGRSRTPPSRGSCHDIRNTLAAHPACRGKPNRGPDRSGVRVRWLPNPGLWHARLLSAGLPDGAANAARSVPADRPARPAARGQDHSACRCSCRHSSPARPRRRCFATRSWSGSALDTPIASNLVGYLVYRGNRSIPRSRYAAVSCRGRG